MDLKEIQDKLNSMLTGTGRKLLAHCISPDFYRRIRVSEGRRD